MNHKVLLVWEGWDGTEVLQGTVTGEELELLKGCSGKLANCDMAEEYEEPIQRLYDTKFQQVLLPAKVYAEHTVIHTGIAP